MLPHGNTMAYSALPVLALVVPSAPSLFSPSRPIRALLVLAPVVPPAPSPFSPSCPMSQSWSFTYKVLKSCYNSQKA